MFLRRGRGDKGGENPRLAAWRISLFFLAAGVWLAGVVIDDTRVTGTAIVLLFAAIVLRLLDRRGDREPGLEDPESDE